MPTKHENRSPKAAASKSSADEAARVVSQLSEGLAAWRWKSPMLGERLDGLRVFQATLAEDHLDYPLATEVCQVLAAERQSWQSGQVSAADLNSLLDRCLAFELKAKTLPEWDTSGHIYGALHSLVNIVNSLRDAAERITEALKRVTQLDSSGIAEPLWGRLRELSAKPEQIPDAHLAGIAKVCEELQDLLPSPEFTAVMSPLRQTRLGNNVVILVAEDDAAWMPDVRQAAEDVAALYRSAARDVTVRSARTYEDALAELKDLPVAAGAEASVLLILDFGIPENAAELALIESGGTTVGRKWGRALLEFARSYRHRYNVIVFTSTANHAHDHRVALECGVRPEDFILKVPGAITTLKESLHNTFLPQTAPRLDLLIDTGCRVRLNGVEVDIDPVPFRTLLILAQHRNRALTVEQIAKFLEQSYPDEYNRSSDLDAAWDRAQAKANEEGLSLESSEGKFRANQILRELNAPINALECWRQALHSQREDIDGGRRNRSVLRSFHRNCLAYESAEPWKWFTGLLKIPAGRTFASWDDALVNRAFALASKELTAARVRPGIFDPHVIHDHIYHIRTVLYAATHLNVHEEFLITENSDHDGYRHRLLADVVILDSTADAPEAQVHDDATYRVLVVENDVAWLDDVQNVLTRGGYSVQHAATIVEAKAKAPVFQPHILCLDLHLPQNGEELELWGQNASVGSSTGGLEVLRDIRKSIPFVKAVVLSSLADDDEIRVQATRSGVVVHDVVSKSGGGAEGTWRDALLSAIWRNEQELRRGVFLPVGRERAPFVSVRLDERDPATRGATVSTVNTEKWIPFGSNEFKLLKIMRDVGGRPVAREELMERLYGDQWPDKQEAFDQVLKRVRQGIVKDGIGLQGKEARHVGTSIISQAGGTYMLNCKFY